MIIQFKNISTSLGMRQLGARLRSEIELAIKNKEQVNLDFDGVNVVSNSFADECFGKLLCTYDMPIVKRHVAFLNANDFVKAVIVNSLTQRRPTINA